MLLIKLPPTTPISNPVACLECYQKNLGVDSMNRKEIKAQVVQLLSDGVAKSDVFTRLAGQGVKERLLAYLIAAHADPQRCRANRGHLLAVRVIAWLQVIVGVLAGYAIGSDISVVAGVLVAGLAAAIVLLFVWGFSKNNVVSYNAYLILTITQLPRQFSCFEERPVSALIGFLIGLAMFVYIWYVRTRIFPDFNFIAPKKMNGKYVFSE